MELRNVFKERKKKKKERKGTGKVTHLKLVLGLSNAKSKGCKEVCWPNCTRKRIFPKTPRSHIPSQDGHLLKTMFTLLVPFQFGIKNSPLYWHKREDLTH